MLQDILVDRFQDSFLLQCNLYLAGLGEGSWRCNSKLWKEDRPYYEESMCLDPWIILSGTCSNLISFSSFDPQIATFQAPGRYLLKPGVDIDSFKGPSPGNGRY